MKVLAIGTKIRLKGEEGDFIEGEIINYLTDDDRVIKGYVAKVHGEECLMIALDDEFEVIV